MVASLVPVSTGHPMSFTKDEATAAQLTWPFYLSNTADGTPATGKTIAGADFKISKAGGAFGNAAGVVTEISLGWYKMVFAAADVDTLGALACELAVEAGVDPLRVTHQVVAFDLNTATVALTDASLTAAKFAADAITAAKIAGDVTTELQSGLATAAGVAAIDVATRTATVGMGTRTTDGAFTALSMDQAIKAEVLVTGTFNGATVTGEITQDPTASPIVWTPRGTPVTAAGTIVIPGPAKAFRAVLSDDGASTSLTCTAAIVTAGI